MGARRTVVGFLRFTYQPDEQGSPRTQYAKTDSLPLPKVELRCEADCKIVDVHDSASIAELDPDLVIWNAGDHGRAWGSTWCHHAYPTPFIQHVTGTDNRLWGVVTYEHLAQFPMLAHPPVLANVDLTINYHPQADIRISFMCEDEFPAPFNNYLAPPPQNKEFLLMAVASRCRNDWTWFETELRTHFTGQSYRRYGNCFPEHLPVPTDDNSSSNKMYWQKVKHMSKAKFMLVFENTRIIDHYVSEKLSHALLAGTVPVIWGSPTILDSLPSPSSAIIVTGTPLEHNPQALAELLKQYDKNDDLYKQTFFAWKSQPLPNHFKDRMRECYLTCGCRLCEWARAHQTCGDDDD